MLMMSRNTGAAPCCACAVHSFWSNKGGNRTMVTDRNLTVLKYPYGISKQVNTVAFTDRQLARRLDRQLSESSMCADRHWRLECWAHTVNFMNKTFSHAVAGCSVKLHYISKDWSFKKIQEYCAAMDAGLQSRQTLTAGHDSWQNTWTYFIANNLNHYF